MPELNETNPGLPAHVQDTANAGCSEGSGSAFNADLLSACIHCGMCLPACPTYLATGREMESPRGRIHLLTMLQKGEAEPTSRLLGHIDSCLGCLGCQTACPSGVQYGKILDQARPLLAQNRDRRLRKLMRFAFSKILPDYDKLHKLGALLRLWQKVGMSKLFEKLPVARKLAGRLAQWQDFLPAVPPYKPLPKQAWMSGEKKGEVQLFAGCVMDVFYNHVNHACLRLLTHQRQIVRVPEQTCCGALAFHAGEVDIARDLAKKNIDLLDTTGGEIVVTAAGCGAMLKNYPELFEADPDWHARAERFSARVKDITEFLSTHEFAVEPKTIEKKVAYHAACHLSHAQNVRTAPEVLLRQIPGVQLIALEEAEHCCGSAGIYNLTNTDLSMDVLKRKMMFLKQTGAELVVTTNPGCLLQIEVGIKQEGPPGMKACHIAEILDQSFS